MKFTNLDFPGFLHHELRTSKDPYWQEVKNRIEQVWNNAPNDLKKRFINLSGKNHKAYRSLIFELYILELLIKDGFEVCYEYQFEGSSNYFDFYARKGNIQFLIEVTSYGPNEEQILNPSFEIDPAAYKKIRRRIKSKLSKVRIQPEVPSLLAFCNSFENATNSRFERVQTLYGVPQIQIDRISLESELILGDQGIWASEAPLISGFSGIYFTNGFMPGFSTYEIPQIWLNPLAANAFSPSQWPDDAHFYKSEVDLYYTNRALEFEWQRIDSIF